MSRGLLALLVSLAPSRRSSEAIQVADATNLRVLHVGPRPAMDDVANGIDVAVWPLLTAQAAEGAKVTLLVGDPVEERVHDIAAANHIGLAVVPTGRRHFAFRQVLAMLTAVQPDVVHLHSVFIPAHAALAAQLRRHRIPYVVSPHGGLNLWRGQLKKAVYGALVEKPYLRRADTIFVLTTRERTVLEGWLGRDGRRYVELPNALPLSHRTCSAISRVPATRAGLAPRLRVPCGASKPSSEDSHASRSGTYWRRPQHHRLVYLGRFDVAKKGLDRLVDVARLLPDVEVRAHGRASHSESPGFRALLGRGLPDNVRFLEPVYGDEKTAALLSASLYVHLSRDEGFGMSIVEAMRLGVPVAVTRGCAISDCLAEEDLGLILPNDPAQAAAEIEATINDGARLAELSRSGREWTIRTLAPAVIAQRTLNAYRATADRARPHCW